MQTCAIDSYGLLLLPSGLMTTQLQLKQKHNRSREHAGRVEEEITQVLLLISNPIPWTCTVRLQEANFCLLVLTYDT